MKCLSLFLSEAMRVDFLNESKCLLEILTLRSNLLWISRVEYLRKVFVFRFQVDLELSGTCCMHRLGFHFLSSWSAFAGSRRR